ncbi:TPA: hypothetical protein VDU60_000306 [Pseudomonas aeruginosa]|uniref:hypothetical protein n=1 Tax=Pseudomonas TaxID=286 RepID=UPI000F7F2D83|nr:hypothetical protein [Pseudomonas aeruginosa]HEK0639908.1 hypothetical protein [Proteus mirabilis]MCO2889547.1 hypothetical protein [Pseudomonas aeruginosa]RTB44052.1 hypothetical protein EJ655_07880 [Pseudomonas aeruginosa]RTB49013.1 hypothetical protein EJ640_22200 [Pseudomonas aeruginosa]RTB87332.1 hypothetical protein EJ641_10380 [Pseudomonas aeruginosa]
MSAGSADFARWENVIEAANAAFERQDDAKALVLYEQAIALARQILESKPWSKAGEQADARLSVFDASVAAFVVSHHNAANLHKRNGKTEDVAALYRQTHRTVSDLSIAPDLEDDLRAIAARHITRTLGEFTYHLQSRAALMPASPGPLDASKRRSH